MSTAQRISEVPGELTDDQIRNALPTASELCRALTGNSTPPLAVPTWAPLAWAGRKALRRALLYTISGLQIQLGSKTFGEGKQSADHLKWMLSELVAQIDVFHADKTGRWIGFAQGVMAANGCLDVDAERDRTRPLFKEAYTLLDDERRHAPADAEGRALLERVPLALHPADERGPCLCSQCELRKAIRTHLTKTKP